MALIGSIEQFTAGDDFDDYLERMDELFKVYEIQEARKVPLFPLIGPEAYNKGHSDARETDIPEKMIAYGYTQIFVRIHCHVLTKYNDQV